MRWSSPYYGQHRSWTHPHYRGGSLGPLGLAVVALVWGGWIFLDRGSQERYLVREATRVAPRHIQIQLQAERQRDPAARDLALAREVELASVELTSRLPLRGARIGQTVKVRVVADVYAEGEPRAFLLSFLKTGGDWRFEEPPLRWP